MSSNRKPLFVIPARGGSKRLPRKNVLPLAGKPLIAWTIEAALSTMLDARIVVSSDDEEVLTISEGYEDQGVISYRRPDEIATDTASTADVLLDVLRAEIAAGIITDTLVLLQPTSPLRNADDIHSALRAYREAGSDKTIVSVCKVDHPTAWVGTLDQNSIFHRPKVADKRSQDYEEEYRLNGAVYVIPVPRFLQDGVIFKEPVIASVMPRERSLDIDDALGFKICEALL
jgi:N-acylneuraminate cytidylyltransferase/CMP-N,N'-diacetyllegionaminic acid synthase